MELDELKKSWHALDDRLEGRPLLNDEEVERLTAAGRADTGRRLERLRGWQRASLWTGAGALLAVAAACLWGGCLSEAEDGGDEHRRLLVLATYLLASIVAGLAWDWNTYRQLRAIRTDRMSVVEVSRRMTRFQHRLRAETVAASLWLLIFNGVFFWAMGYHEAPAPTQALVAALLLAADALIVYLLYKKVMYRHLRDIRKNIEELKDICTE